MDIYSHLGAVKANGQTIAVLGSGFHHIYPAEHKEYCKKILQTKGAIITEYEPKTRPLKMNFPARNRIISGLSEGVLVVEAKEKSGTLITVDYALEQGKEVFVIPGNITSNKSYGTNELLKQGAKLVTSVQEIIEEISFDKN
ncbi:MAG: DNA-processing protein DprA [Clostridia bacterium]|nr:DNA-processing protein DprA [Clostridia bacterium]